jgi:RNA polymerase sigma factor (TIGR02999 family)
MRNDVESLIAGHAIDHRRLLPFERTSIRLVCDGQAAQVTDVLADRERTVDLLAGQLLHSDFAPMMAPMTDVTRILSAIEQGDRRAAEQLLPLVYDELRKLAAQKMAQESPGQTLQATALVHDAYLRLVDVPEAQQWDSRRHFFAAAAEAMRRILVESARRKQRQKHGGGRIREPDASEIPCPERPERVLALDDALDRLQTTNAQVADLVKLRYFAGFSNADAAEVLGISPRKANQVWAYARAWLREELGDDEEG